MRIKIFAFIWFAALAAAPITLSADDGCCDKPAAACCENAAAACCDKPDMNCCNKAATHNHGAKMACCNDGSKCDMPCCADGECDMPCCNEDDVNSDAIDLLISMDARAVLLPPPADVVRQTATVWFKRPVWVGQKVLMGKYIIEHDLDRQARGEPCTHIYAADDDKSPVVTFHCTHINTVTAERDVVLLKPLGDGQAKFVQFQFAGEHAAHGYPTGR